MFHPVKNRQNQKMRSSFNAILLVSYRILLSTIIVLLVAVVKVTSYSNQNQNQNQNRNLQHKTKPNSLISAYSRRQTLALPWIEAIALEASLAPLNPLATALAITERNDSITTATTTITTAPSESSHRPRAPLTALLPAMQQRLLLEQCLSLTTMYLNASTTSDEEYLLSQLKSILPQDTDTDTDTESIANHWSSHYQQQQQQQQQQLSGITMRTTCNIYTKQLRFADTYVLTADQTIKSRIIRRDGGIPTVQQVVIADLDLRDLYRNDMQTLVDDATAELYSPNRSKEELNSLLIKAIQASDKWLALISEDDIMEARHAVSLLTTGR
jgi:hypothetical protein